MKECGVVQRQKTGSKPVYIVAKQWVGQRDDRRCCLILGCCYIRFFKIFWLLFLGAVFRVVIIHCLRCEANNYC